MIRMRALAVAVLLVAAGCSDSDDGASDGGSTTTSGSTVDGSGAGTTSTLDGGLASDTTASTSSTSSTSTSSTSSTTSTTAAPVPVEGLDLAVDGLGDALFGAESDGVVDYVTAILGAPTFDTGWADPYTLGRVCPGTEVRIVAWDDLSLFFTDESLVTTGTRHFASYTYGEAFGPVIKPFGLTTFAGLGVGATLEQLQATYPEGIYAPADELSGPVYVVEDGLFAHLADQGGTLVATAYVGGFGCGE